MEEIKPEELEYETVKWDGLVNNNDKIDFIVSSEQFKEVLR